MQPTLMDGGRIIALDDMQFHAVWLRDNILDASTRDQKNGQRLSPWPMFPRIPGFWPPVSKPEC